MRREGRLGAKGLSPERHGSRNRTRLGRRREDVAAQADEGSKAGWAAPGDARRDLAPNGRTGLKRTKAPIGALVC